jgi:hypothetical protein
MNSKLYVRSTRALEPGDLPEPFRSRVEEHAAQRNLALSSWRAWLTHSENPPATGFFVSVRRTAS